MESIFKNVDEDKTIDNAKRVLGEYRRWKLKARRVSFSLQSPTYDGMPKSPNYENTADAKHVNRLNAQFMYTLVEKVIDAAGEIDDSTAVYSKILLYKYIYGWTNVKCAQRLDSMAERTFDRYLREALLTFAEIYPDAVEDLIAKKYKPDQHVNFSFE
ncbi:ArpU family phage packaging/lysis transcriptional regulator [Levilactobacillus brevis]|uniref:ArpU family phage packaging/lysis transcriptional regulator n=1 Tax=Levilactobacillus brevis TaxID=1580 RepID=UPI00351671E4